jgi:hypothetical protein
VPISALIMKKMIYVKLLDEGTDVYRAVPAIKINENVYKLEGINLYDPSDEKWEFLPESYVDVAERIFNNEKALVAIKVSDPFVDGEL